MGDLTPPKSVPGGTLRARAWCFVINNFTADDILRCTLAHTGARYIVYGREIGEKCNTPHLQGYIQFENPRRLAGVSKLLPRAALFVSRDSGRRAMLYCKKGLQPKSEWEDLHECGPHFGVGARVFEEGEFSTQGQRTDLQEIRDKLRLGASYADFVNDGLDSQQLRYVRDVRGHLGPRRTAPPKVYWLWGPPGASKTRAALELAGGEDRAFVTSSLKWFDGYDAQDTIIFDDFRFDPGALPFWKLLRLIDRYDVSVEVKFGSIRVTSSRIVFTSPLPPERAFPSVGAEDLSQVLRRLTAVVEVLADPAAPVAQPVRLKALGSDVVKMLREAENCKAVASKPAGHFVSGTDVGGVILAPPTSCLDSGSHSSRDDNVSVASLSDKDINDLLEGLGG